jgi:3-hydroxybutyryl-CoA dehydrogenase
MNRILKMVASMEKIGVVGCGTMGAGIAALALQKGFSVVVQEMEQEFLEKGLARIEKMLEKLEQKGELPGDGKQSCLVRLSPATSIEDLASCDLVIEAIFENLEAKQNLFKSLDGICREETIFATNTSSLCVTEISSAVNRKDRFLGLHFFNPATIMPLVEIIRTINTERSVIKKMEDLADRLGKTAIIAKDNAGFIVNLFLTAFLLDAMRGVDQGIASVEDIDLGMKLGCNHPMGPLMLADFIGLDLIYGAANRMFEEYRDSRYAPPPILKRLVLLNDLGKKTGKGFYDWSDPRYPLSRSLTI